MRILRVVQGGLPDGELEYRVAEARETLNFLHLQVGPDDWVLLEAVAEGVPYAVLARMRGVSEGSLRVRVSRIRAVLKKAA